jgi:hypothetical protein
MVDGASVPDGTGGVRQVDDTARVIHLIDYASKR